MEPKLTIHEFLERYNNYFGEHIELIEQFSRCFSRFEYALMKAGFIVCSPKGYAEVDWFNVIRVC